MDFDDAKENIQPLQAGRNASILQAALTSNAELNKQREHFEDAINNYTGEDPLESWYEYILWIEQSYPSGGSECGLKKLLLKCLEIFEKDERYFQDRRMIKIYIKYIDTEENPQHLLEELFKAGIGTMVADLYICWAFYYDLLGNFKQADHIFKRGLEMKAQPFEDLDQAHKHFGFTMSQRLLCQGDSEGLMNSLKERRYALTSLRVHRKNKVGSIRTGDAIKNNNPGKIQIQKTEDNFEVNSTSNKNINVQVFEDENFDPNVASAMLKDDSKSVVQNIIDSARKQENLREPGPWTECTVKQKRPPLFKTKQNHDLGFEILEDGFLEEIPLPCFPDHYSKGIQLPPDFPKCNYPQGQWKISIIKDTKIEPNTVCAYPKFYCYPNAPIEFSPEEYRAYKWLKNRGIENNFTRNGDNYWNCLGIRLYPLFPIKNELDDRHFQLSEFDPFMIDLPVNLNEIYTAEEEMQFEEILWKKIKNGKRKLTFNLEETIRMTQEMDETACLVDVVGRRSIFPSRKSMAPAGFGLIKKPNFVASIGVDEGEQPLIEKTTFQKRTFSPEELSAIKSHSTNDNTTKINEISKTTSNFEIKLSKGEEYFPISEKTAKLRIQNNVKLDSDTDINFREKEVSEILENNLPSSNEEIENSKINFIIYEDNHSKSGKNSHKTQDTQNFEFLAPVPPKNAALQQLPFQIYEESCDNGTLFAPNESCSTQIFNVNLKPQSVSTPVSKKNRSLLYENETSEKQLQENLPIVQLFPTNTQTCSTPSPPELHQQSCAMNPFKQLSTIMETSETNTLAATGSTKSSVDTHSTNNACSPETDAILDKNLNGDVMKQNSKVDFPLNNPSNNLHEIPEVNEVENQFIPNIFNKIDDKEINKFAEKQNSLILKGNSTICDATLSIKLQSLKFNEEKTDTIPKTLLKRPLLFERSSECAEMLFSLNKTPEKKKVPQEKNFGFEAIGDTETFSKLNNMTLSRIANNYCSSKLLNSFAESSPQIKISKTTPRFDFKENASEIFDFFKTPVKSKKFGCTEKNDICKVGTSLMNPSLFSRIEGEKNQGKLNESKKIEDIDISMKKLPFLKSKSSNEELFFSNKLILDDLSKNNAENLDSDQSKITSINRGQILNFAGIKETGQERNVTNPLSSQKRNFLFPYGEEQYNYTSGLQQPTSLNLKNGNCPSPNYKRDEELPFNLPKTYRPVERHFEGSIQINDAIKPNSNQKKTLSFFPNFNICEKSLHIKDENLFCDEWESFSSTNKINPNQKPILITQIRTEANPQLQFEKNNSVEPEIGVLPLSISHQLEDDGEFNDNLGRSIYNASSLNTPKSSKLEWSDKDNIDEIEDSQSIHYPDLDYTSHKLEDSNINPFSKELIKSFLDQLEILNYFENLPYCVLTSKVQRLRKTEVIEIIDKKIEIMKIIGEGSYGTIYCGKDVKSEKLFALKQEKPCNLWEFYICLELKSRLKNISILPGFMNIEYALIAKNASIYVTDYYKYGSLITVCNKIKLVTTKNVDELVVMFLSEQILSIVDHLHGCNIIHADIKPDNFLITRRLDFDDDVPSVQLIDFGVSIDMELFPKGKTFRYIHSTEEFKCVEMRENRSWTFQTDLYGVASTIHVLLYGNYMDIKKTMNLGWLPIQRIPRYFNKNVWETIFNQLLNIRDCSSMPSLQNMRALLKEEIELKERFVKEKIKEFNYALDS